MSNLREKFESHWLSITCIVVLGTASATSAYWYWHAIDPRNILLSEKSSRISELENKLRFAHEQVESSEKTCQDKIDKALTASEKIFEKEIRICNQSIAALQTTISNSKSKLEDTRSALNALQTKYDTALTNNAKLRSALSKNGIRRHLLGEIECLQAKERELKVLRIQVLASIEKLIPQVVNLEYRCSGKSGIISGCKEAATARMILEKEKNELSWLEKQIEQTNEQIITLESKM